MTVTVKRQKEYKNFSVSEEGENILVPVKEFEEKTGTRSAVRIVLDEYENIDASKQFFTHFNLEDSDSKPGNIYIFPKIMKVGFFDHTTGEEVLPLLSFEDVFVCKCVSIENNVKYEDIDPKVFEFSMKTIYNVATLKEAIWRRYSKSMPALSREKMERLGVGISSYEILEKKTFKFKNS